MACQQVLGEDEVDLRITTETERIRREAGESETRKEQQQWLGKDEAAKVHVAIGSWLRCALSHESTIGIKCGSATRPEPDTAHDQPKSSSMIRISR